MDEAVVITEQTTTADERLTTVASASKSGAASVSSAVEAERRRWRPTLEDTEAPVVGEFKYPLEKPAGPVLCTSRVTKTHCPGLTKQMMRRGRPGAPAPVDGSTCYVWYDMWQLNESEAEVWGTRSEAEPHQVVVGEVPTEEKKRHYAGLSECLRTMVEGERSLFRVPPHLCYGETGNFSFPAVPPDCWMLADVELIGVKGSAEAPEMARADMMYEERMARVKEHRQIGNGLFRGGDVAGAAREYEMTLSFLTDDMMMQLFGKYVEEANSEKLPAHLNLSACYLKLERYNDAIDQAGRALGVEPKNPKAFYRRGRAKQALGQDDGAKEDLLKALKHSPDGNDPAIRKALRELDVEEGRKARARKGMFDGLFGDDAGMDGEERKAQARIDDVNDARRVDTSRECEASSIPENQRELAGDSGVGLFGRIGKAFGFGRRS